MPRNGSGTYSTPNSFSANTTIESAKVNQNFSDIGSEITASLPRNGEASMSGQFKASDGTSTAPGISFSSDTDTGFYRASANTIAVSGTLTTNGTIKYDAFPSGTALLFVQTNAPTGWTKSTTHDNKALRVVSGTASSGGSTGFTSVFAARTILEANLPAHTHGVGTLVTSSTGAKDTVIYWNNSPVGGATGDRMENLSPTSGESSETFNTASNHTHTISGSTGSTGSGQALDFAVAYVDVVICTKD